uniref:Uncharacterized protein n=1 Tax=Arundo donax TaxID=35708 RepID=A0A0A9CU33_ARUDO
MNQGKYPLVASLSPPARIEVCNMTQLPTDQPFRCQASPASTFAKVAFVCYISMPDRSKARSRGGL